MGNQSFRLLAAVLVLATIAGSLATSAADDRLQPIASKLMRQYPDLVQLTPEELEKRQAEAGSMVVIDARTPGEYAVSHIKGAIRVDPAASAATVVAAAGDVAGKSVVFYCTVGGRSSRLASSAKAALLAEGAKDVANLTGGVLAWHNAGRPLVNDAGETEFVHPSSGDMARLLNRADLARMSIKEACPSC